VVGVNVTGGGSLEWSNAVRIEGGEGFPFDLRPEDPPAPVVGAVPHVSEDVACGAATPPVPELFTCGFCWRETVPADVESTWWAVETPNFWFGPDGTPPRPYPPLHACCPTCKPLVDARDWRPLVDLVLGRYAGRGGDVRSHFRSGVAAYFGRLGDHIVGARPVRVRARQVPDHG
jgi:hypothetical protein